MAYDNFGRWVPSEDIDWTQNTADLTATLAESGLDWRDEGKYAFKTDEWGELSGSQRIGILQAYDAWYDEGNQEDLEDEAWGLDIQREITYNSTWTAQEAFHALAGGTGTKVWKEGNVHDLQNPYKYSQKDRRTVVGRKTDASGKEWTQFIERQYPMDWKQYTNDNLYRATIDELLEKDYMMFMGEGADFDNATQVRAANKEVQSWIDEAYQKAHDLGEDETWAQNEFEKEVELQKANARIHNVRYPEGQNTRGFQHNQQVDIRKYQPWNKFDPETGTRTSINPKTGEIRDTFKHKSVAEPTRMSIVGDKLQQNVEEGVFYSNTMGSQDAITDSLKQKPDELVPPRLTIRKVNVRKPANVDASWKMKGDLKGPAV